MICIYLRKGPLFIFREQNMKSWVYLVKGLGLAPIFLEEGKGFL